jgi:Protein of unknown function (DUF2934)
MANLGMRTMIHVAVEARAYAILESKNDPLGRDSAHWFQARADLEIAKDLIV